MEYRFGIIPALIREIPHKRDFEPILLFPSLNSDFEIILRNDKKDDAFYKALALAALKKYFFEIRALPLEEIEISHSVSNFKLKNSNKTVLELPKSKQRFTKRSVFTLLIFLRRYSRDNRSFGSSD